MRIERVVLRTLRLRLKEPFRSASGRTRERTVLLLCLEGDGLEGLGECVALDTPHYSPETVDSARHVLERYLVPAVIGRRFERALELGSLMDGLVKGHRMAKAAIEMAVWDAEARGRGMSLATLLNDGTRSRGEDAADPGGVSTAVSSEVPAEVPAGVVLGVEDDDATLLERVDAFVAQGYRRVKLKVSPGRDLTFLEAVRARYPRLPLTVDANGSYDPGSSGNQERLTALDDFGLLYIEQPFGDDELVAHAALQARLSTPVCLDESVSSPAQCRTALALRACGVVNIKPGRVGGHGAAREIHDLCLDAGVGVWCGGMLESGVGRAHNVALATLPNMRFPGDVSASDRYWERDIVVPPFELRSDGMMPVPQGAGIGVELDEDYVRHVEVDRVELRQETGHG